jgi:hypothetical protein
MDQRSEIDIWAGARLEQRWLRHGSSASGRARLERFRFRFRKLA